MEWSRIKTILIWVFAVVNIFLLSIYFKEADGGKTLDEEVVISTVEILSKNNISIDSKAIPRNFGNVKVCTVENAYADTNAFLESVVLDAKNFTVEGDSFVYTPADKAAEVDAEDVLREAGLLAPGGYKKIKTDGYEYYYPRFENAVFFDSYIKVKLEDGAVREIRGKNWLGDRISEEGVAEVVSPAEILIDFSSRYDGTEKITVTGMNAGYYIGQRTGKVRITAAPVWQIAVSDGTEFYYDMRNGDLLK